MNIDTPDSPRLQLRCGACLRRSPQFDSAYCPFIYDYPLDHLIRGLKYRGEVVHGRLLGRLFASELRLQRTQPLPELLIPVPLAYRRFRERGYNQAIELGTAIEHDLGIRLCTDAIERRRETAVQAGLTRRARRRNIKGAFAMLRQPPAKHVAIIDDVVTTGGTVDEMSRVLKRSGVQRIEIWALARAVHNGLKMNSNAMPTNTAMPK